MYGTVKGATLMFFNIFLMLAFAIVLGTQINLSQALSFTRRDNYLSNYVLRSLPGQRDWLDCTLACGQDAKCVSYNYDRNGRLCELNDHGVEQVANADSELNFVEGWSYHQIRPVTRTEKKRALSNHCDCNCGSSQQCIVEPKLGDSPQKPAKSCSDILRERGSVPNGPYYLQAAGNHPVYCHMEKINECDNAGGWTLVMKIDGKKGTFKYGSNFWTNGETYQKQHGSDLERVETKLKPFSQFQTETGFCLGMELNGERKWVMVKSHGQSLYGRVAASPEYHPFRDTSEVPAWRGLIAKNSSMQDTGDGDKMFGFNAHTSNGDARARIGLITKGSVQFESRLGFGTSGSAGGVDATNSCGEEVPADSNKGQSSVKAFCFIMAK